MVFLFEYLFLERRGPVHSIIQTPEQLFGSVIDRRSSLYIDAPMLLMLHHRCLHGCIDNGTHFIHKVPPVLQSDVLRDPHPSNQLQQSGGADVDSPSSVVSFAEKEAALESHLNDYFGGSTTLWSTSCFDQTNAANRETRWGLWGAVVPGEPIDVVYTWVNGSDPEHLRLRASIGGSDPNVKQNEQFETHDELRFSLRSIHTFAPWIRKIFIVVAGRTQIPSFIDPRHPKVSIVFHEDIFKEANCSHHLPTFNSNAIETHLHRIPGLSDHYIYLNDDVLFGDHICIEDFYNPRDGYRIFVENVSKLTPTTSPTGLNNQWKAAWNAHQLLNGMFGKENRGLITHTPQLYNKHIVEHIQRRFWNEYSTTSSNRFRSGSDLSSAFLYYHYLIESTDIIFRAAKNAATPEANEYMFHKLADMNGDGVVDKKELEDLLWSCSLSQSRESVQDMIRTIVGEDTVLEGGSSSLIAKVGDDAERVTLMKDELVTVRTRHGQDPRFGVTYEMLSRSSGALNLFRNKLNSWTPRMFKTQTVVPDLSFELLSVNGIEKSLMQVLSRRPKFICLNDAFSNTATMIPVQRTRMNDLMRKFYEVYFPHPSPWERL